MVRRRVVLILALETFPCSAGHEAAVIGSIAEASVGQADVDTPPRGAGLGPLRLELREGLLNVRAGIECVASAVVTQAFHEDSVERAALQRGAAEVIGESFELVDAVIDASNAKRPEVRNWIQIEVSHVTKSVGRCGKRQEGDGSNEDSHNLQEKEKKEKKEKEKTRRQKRKRKRKKGKRKRNMRKKKKRGTTTRNETI